MSRFTYEGVPRQVLAPGNVTYPKGKRPLICLTHTDHPQCWQVLDGCYQPGALILIYEKAKPKKGEISSVIWLDEEWRPIRISEKNNVVQVFHDPPPTMNFTNTHTEPGPSTAVNFAQIMTEPMYWESESLDVKPVIRIMSMPRDRALPRGPNVQPYQVPAPRSRPASIRYHSRPIGVAVNQCQPTGFPVNQSRPTGVAVNQCRPTGFPVNQCRPSRPTKSRVQHRLLPPPKPCQMPLTQPEGNPLQDFDVDDKYLDSKIVSHFATDAELPILPANVVDMCLKEEAHKKRAIEAIKEHISYMARECEQQKTRQSKAEKIMGILNEYKKLTSVPEPAQRQPRPTKQLTQRIRQQQPQHNIRNPNQAATRMRKPSSFVQPALQPAPKRCRLERPTQRKPVRLPSRPQIRMAPPIVETVLPKASPMQAPEGSLSPVLPKPRLETTPPPQGGHFMPPTREFSQSRTLPIAPVF